MKQFNSIQFEIKEYQPKYDQVEAIQVPCGNVESVLLPLLSDWLAETDAQVKLHDNGYNYLVIYINDDRYTLSAGDYVVRDVDNNVTVYEEELFHKIYELK
jgi:hypothetical protein